MGRENSEVPETMIISTRKYIKEMQKRLNEMEGLVDYFNKIKLSELDKEKFEMAHGIKCKMLTVENVDADTKEFLTLVDFEKAFGFGKVVNYSKGRGLVFDTKKDFGMRDIFYTEPKIELPEGLENLYRFFAEYGDTDSVKKIKEKIESLQEKGDYNKISNPLHKYHLKTLRKIRSEEIIALVNCSKINDFELETHRGTGHGQCTYGFPVKFAGYDQVNGQKYSSLPALELLQSLQKG